jgi:hypothetical protein
VKTRGQAHLTSTCLLKTDEIKLVEGVCLPVCLRWSAWASEQWLISQGGCAHRFLCSHGGSGCTAQGAA